MIDSSDRLRDKRGSKNEVKKPLDSFSNATWLSRHAERHTNRALTDPLDWDEGVARLLREYEAKATRAIPAARAKSVFLLDTSCKLMAYAAKITARANRMM